MTIHAEIIDVNCKPSGWVEVDPIDYDYTGPDPDGEVLAYLERLKNGTREFHWPIEDDVHDGEYPPDLKMAAILTELAKLDEVWYVDPEDSYTVTTIEYGGG